MPTRKKSLKGKWNKKGINKCQSLMQTFLMRFSEAGSIGRIHGSNSRWRRIAWSIMVLGTALLMTYMTYKVVKEYFDYNKTVETAIHDLKTVKVGSEDQIAKLKITVSNMENAAGDAEKSFEDQLSSLKEKQAQYLKERDLIHKKEIARIKEEFSDLEKKLRLQITTLENCNSDLEKQIINKEAENKNIKAFGEEAIEELRKKMKSDEEKLRQQMEERIELLESANKKQEHLLREQLQAMHQIKKEASEADILLAEEAHRAQHLQLSLESKDAEMRAAVAKVRLEGKEQLEELSRVKASLEDSLAQNTSLERKIKELGERHKEDMKEKNEEVENLKCEIEKQKNKLRDLLQNETTRINDLQNALSSYFHSVKRAKSNLEDELNTGS